MQAVPDLKGFSGVGFIFYGRYFLEFFLLKFSLNVCKNLFPKLVFFKINWLAYNLVS